MSNRRPTDVEVLQQRVRLAEGRLVRALLALTAGHKVNPCECPSGPVHCILDEDWVKELPL